jgi:hypothetical protein
MGSIVREGVTQDLRVNWPGLMVPTGWGLVFPLDCWSMLLGINGCVGSNALVMHGALQQIHRLAAAGKWL